MREDGTPFNIMAGAVVGSDQPFAATTPERDRRLACSVSLLSFILGFDATFFRNLVSTASRHYKDGAAPKGSSPDASGGQG